MVRIRLVLVESFAEDIVATTRVLSTDSRFEIVATGTQAPSREELEAHRPDLVLLDLALLRRGSKRLPIADLVARGVRLALLTDEVEWATRTAREEAARALIEGALDLVYRPPSGANPAHDAPACQAFCAQVAALAQSSRPLGRPSTPPVSRNERLDVVGVVASTGGPTALAQLLREPLRVPVLIAQHMPTGFARGFARTLHKVTRQAVHLAEDGARAEPGKVYLPPDGMDLGITRALKLRLSARGERAPHPSGDVLLEDLAVFGRRAVGVVLTGMGEDGLRGARKLHAAGGRILVQDQASCVVFGMPGAIAAAGLAEQILPPGAIADQLREWS